VSAISVGGGVDLPTGLMGINFSKEEGIGALAWSKYVHE
jgi:hypothetical protein